jgi:hypothetical protein
VLLAIILLLKLFIAEPQVFLFTGFSLYALSGPARWLVIRGRRLGGGRRNRSLTTSRDSTSKEAS